MGETEVDCEIFGQERIQGLQEGPAVRFVHDLEMAEGGNVGRGHLPCVPEGCERLCHRLLGGEPRSQVRVGITFPMTVLYLLIAEYPPEEVRAPPLYGPLQPLH